MTRAGITQTPAPLGVAINFKRLDLAYAARLSAFFKEQLERGINEWEENTPYTLNDGTTFHFTNRIFRRDKKGGKNGFVLEAITHKGAFSNGSFGKVHKVQRTITIEEEGAFGIKKQGSDGLRRVVKIQLHSEKESNPLSVLQREYELTKQAGHISIKKPYIIENPSNKEEHISYTVMDMLPGKDLFDVMQDDSNKTRPLSIQERIDLTYALLVALKEQVSDKGLVHRDIKPENIRVLLGRPIIVKIFDFGGAMQEDNPDRRLRGTAEYIAKEAATTPFSPDIKADVFSMGRVIAELWGVKLTPLFGKFGFSWMWRPPENGFYPGLFSNIADIPEYVRTGIDTMLYGMLKVKPETRKSIDETIGFFESFYKPQATIEQEYKSENQKQQEAQQPVWPTARAPDGLQNKPTYPDSAEKRAFINYIKELPHASSRKLQFFSKDPEVQEAIAYFKAYQTVRSDIESIRRMSGDDSKTKAAKISAVIEGFFNETSMFSKKAVSLTTSQKCKKALCVFLGVVLGGLIGAVIGAVSGVAMGFALGSCVPTFGNLVGAVLGGGFAAVAGALTGAGIGVAIATNVAVSVLSATPQEAMQIKFIKSIEDGVKSLQNEPLPTDVRP